MPNLSTLYRRGVDVREAARVCHLTLKTAKLEYAKLEYAKLAAQEAADRECAPAATASLSFAPIGVMPFVLDVADARCALAQPEDAMVSYTYHSVMPRGASSASLYGAPVSY